MNLLQIKNLTTTFNTDCGKIIAVDDISFSLKKGEVLGIIGESGSGKSVTSLSIMNLIPKPNGCIEKGSILFHNNDLLKLSDSEMCNIRGNKISMIFQEPMISLNPVFTVGNQILEVLKIHKKGSKTENKQKVLEILNNLKIPNPEEIIKKYPFELSGGMCQRIMIAIAMACNPEIIIADEPTTALDVTTQAEILDLLKNITAHSNCSVLFITHDLGIIAELANRVIVMYKGKIVEECDVLEFFNNPLHPYSKALIKSMPQKFNKRFFSIKGSIPSPYEHIKGCPYNTRCDKCIDICFIKAPPIKKINFNHTVCCWLNKE